MNTPDEIMRKLRAIGMSQREISEIVGLSKSSVGYRLNPESRKHRIEYLRNWREENDYAGMVREKYNTDPEFQEKRKEAAKKWQRKKFQSLF